MKPQEVNPQNFKVKNIIYTSSNGDFSVAEGEYEEDGVNRLALRWNGIINDPNDKGYPKVFGHPMWFQLPDDITDLLKTFENFSK